MEGLNNGDTAWMAMCCAVHDAWVGIFIAA